MEDQKPGLVRQQDAKGEGLEQKVNVSKRSEVKSRTQGSRPRTQNKCKAKNSPSDDRPSRGQGQECSRPRTKDIGASVLKKERSSKRFFRRSKKKKFPKFFSGELQKKGVQNNF